MDANRSNVIILGIHLKYSKKCKNSRALFSKDVFSSMKVFFQLATPSARMVCLAGWASEVIMILSGMLHDPKLETSVSFTIIYLHFNISNAFGATASIRVSNELGAGNPQATKVAIWSIMALLVAEVLIASTAFILCRRIIGHILSNSKEVVHQLVDMGPFICLCIIMDAFQIVLSGIVRRSGWQRIGACINLVAYYMVGIPVIAVLAFIMHWKVKGLLIRLAKGSFMQAVLLGLITNFIDWQKQASKARERILAGDHFTAQS